MFTSGGLSAGLAAAAAGEDVCWLTLEEASEAIRTRRLTSVQLAEACLARVARLNPRLNAFITVAADGALARARALDEQLQSGHWRGPLHGIPVALKDLIDTKGVRTTAGSAQFETRIPRAGRRRCAPPGQRWRGAGRQNQSRRVRLQLHRGNQPLRSQPQSVGYQTDARRQFRRLGSRGGFRHVLRIAG